ncbi:MAG TPA: hypothetical protein VMQ58_00985 [Candidatus Saccharimonadales bacterium]|nr:hypothetical protein [Candidatus Saccharimonadales bacterium]
MANPNLTWLVIGIAAFIATVALASQAYTDFNLSNNINNNYAPADQAYANISSYINTQGDLLNINSRYRVNGWSLITDTISGISSSLTAFMIGFGAIRVLLDVPAFMLGLFNTLSSVTGIPSALYWFISFAMVFYVGMKIIQAFRGTIQSP